MLERREAMLLLLRFIPVHKRRLKLTGRARPFCQSNFINEFFGCEINESKPKAIDAIKELRK